MPRKKSPPIPVSQADLNYCEFGNALRKLIKAKGYTQEGFAEAIGVSYSAMMSILKGERRVYLHVYRKIIDVLGVNDIVIMSHISDDPVLYEKAQLYMKLASKLDKIPPSVLSRIVSLLDELEK
ncbi:MAG: helix-turn-helix transcriptional regulator [Clostridia bacterium]|nr:helix-turn-helix transcriptional regulator [Clostridia bacterium]